MQESMDNFIYTPNSPEFDVRTYEGYLEYLEFRHKIYLATVVDLLNGDPPWNHLSQDQKAKTITDFSLQADKIAQEIFRVSYCDEVGRF